MIIRSILLFLAAGFCEIGGGYLIWMWIKEGKSIWYGIFGGIILVLYGIIAAFQNSNFGRVYATYGGFFIVLALVWAYKAEGYVPDKFDIIGALIALIGVLIIYAAPRGAL